MGPSRAALVDLLYETLVESGQCSDYVRVLLDVSGSWCSFAVFEDMVRPELRRFRDLGFGEPMEPLYRDVLADLPIWERSRANGTWEIAGRLGGVVDVAHLGTIPEELRAGGAAFLDIEEPSCTSRLRTALFRRQALGPYTKVQQAVLHALVPHYRRWLKLYRRARLLREGVDAAVESVSVPCVLVDASRRLVASNGAADALIASGGIMMLQDGRLSIRSIDLDELLSKARSAGADVSTAAGVARIPRRNRLPAFVSASSLCGADRCEYSKVVALTLHDPEQKRLPSNRILMDVYGLTPAEARVTRSVLSGFTVAETAGVLGVSADTVKYHLKSIFSKFGVRRQSELVGHLLSAKIDLLDPPGSFE